MRRIQWVVAIAGEMLKRVSEQAARWHVLAIQIVAVGMRDLFGQTKHTKAFVLSRHGGRRVMQMTEALQIAFACGRVGVGRTGRRARDDDSIKARQHAVQIRCIPLDQRRRSHDWSPHRRSGVYRSPCLVPACPA